MTPISLRVSVMSGFRLGAVYGDSVLLPGGARLRAQEPAPGASFASWRQNPLRKRLRLLRATAWVLCCGALAVSLLGLTESVQRSLIPFVQVPAVVTAATSEGRQTDCHVLLAFLFDGRAPTGSYRVNTTCRELPGTGNRVDLKVNPEDPTDVVIVGHEASDPNLPLPIGLASGAAFLATGLFVIRCERSWRRARLLAANDPDWLQLTGTVTVHKSGMFHEVFILDGEGIKDSRSRCRSSSPLGRRSRSRARSSPSTCSPTAALRRSSPWENARGTGWQPSQPLSLRRGVLPAEDMLGASSGV